MLNLHGEAIEKLLKISSEALALIVILGNYGQVSHPSKKVLMSKLKMKDSRTFKKLVNSVVKAGYLKVEERIGQSKKYIILLEGVTKFNGKSPAKNGGGAKFAGGAKNDPPQKMTPLKNTPPIFCTPLFIESNTSIESNKELIIENAKKGGSPFEKSNEQENQKPNLDAKNQSSEKEKKLREKKKKEDEQLAKAFEVLDFFKEVTGKKLMYAKSRADQLKSSKVRDVFRALDYGHTVDECKGIIFIKNEAWKGEEKTREWIRTSTLFRKIHLEEYLDDLINSPFAGVNWSNWEEETKIIKQQHYEQQTNNKQGQPTGSKERAASSNKIEFGSRTKRLKENGGWS